MTFIKVLDGLDFDGNVVIQALEFVGYDVFGNLVYEGPFAISQAGLWKAIKLARMHQLISSEGATDIISEFLGQLPKTSNLDFVPRTSEAAFVLHGRSFLEGTYHGVERRH